MLPDCGNDNCYEYLRRCTSIYGDVYMMEHFGHKYYKSEILRDMDALAAYFKLELGLKRGDVYTVFSPTTVQSIIAFYALNKIGVIANFVHPLMSSDFLKETVEDVHAKGIMVLDILAKKHIDTINATGLPCLVTCSSDYSSGIKKAGSRAGEGLAHAIFPKYKNYTLYRKAIKMFPRGCVGFTQNAGDMAAYLNGGGTTGKAKTIMLTSRAINELCYRVSDLDEIHVPGYEAEVVVLPLFHCFGLCLATHMALCNSARVIPMMQFDSGIFCRLMKRDCVVGILGIPLMFEKLMKDKDFDGPWLKNIRLMFCGGDNVTDEFLDEFNSYFEKWGAVGRLRQGYGLTEISSVCCANTNTDYKRGTIGKPLRGVVMDIWDENCRSVKDGSIGELVISGPTIMSGYYMGDGKTGYGLTEDENGVQWVQSGDLGRRDEDGFYYFAGRKKRVIIISGYNVYPNDIEKKVSELSFIRDVCAVQGWKNGRSIVRLFASLKTPGDEEKYREIITTTCENSFSKFYIPREIVFLKDLPQTPLMKVDYRKLTQDKPDDPIYEPPVERPGLNLPI